MNLYRKVIGDETVENHSGTYCVIIIFCIFITCFFVPQNFLSLRTEIMLEIPRWVQKISLVFAAWLLLFCCFLLAFEELEKYSDPKWLCCCCCVCAKKTPKHHPKWSFGIQIISTTLIDWVFFESTHKTQTRVQVDWDDDRISVPSRHCRHRSLCCNSHSPSSSCTE